MPASTTRTTEFDAGKSSLIIPILTIGTWTFDPICNVTSLSVPHCATNRLLRCLSHGYLRFFSENSIVSLDIVSVSLA